MLLLLLYDLAGDFDIGETSRQPCGLSFPRGRQGEMMICGKVSGSTCSEIPGVSLWFDKGWLHNQMLVLLKVCFPNPGFQTKSILMFLSFPKQKWAFGGRRNFRRWGFGKSVATLLARLGGLAWLGVGTRGNWMPRAG